MNMNTPAYYNKVIIITGGSSGIGFALAKAFATQQARIVIIARNAGRLAQAKAELEKLGQTPVLTYSANVCDEQEITAAIDDAGSSLGGIDVLINCAGIITCGRFVDQPVTDLRACMSTNYFGSVYATRAAWPWLRKNKGQLSFVSSVAGYMGLIGYSSYSPAKFAMTGLAECLWQEGKDDNIRVSVCYPPDTDTPLLTYEHAHTLPESRALSQNIKMKTPEHVAAKYLQGLIRNKFEIYCDFDSITVRFLKNNLPRFFRYYTGRIIQKSRR